MKPHLGLAGIIGGSAIVLMATQPADAAATRVTGVQVNSTASGVTVVLETQDGDRPQVFTVTRGNSLVADVTNTQLRLPEGNGFLQNNPAPGIAMVMVSQLDANSIRVTITGETAAPASQVSQNGDEIVFTVSSSGGVATSEPGQPISIQPSGPGSVAQVPVPPPPVAPAPEVMVPNPQVLIEGVPAIPSSTSPGGLPPLQPRAIAPPVGDIAIATTDVTPSTISLGTSEIVPRLVLRDAPVRDVLSLLGRAAGLNVAYIDNAASGSDPAAAAVPGGQTEGVNTRISLDIENEPVENVFNYVLRISGLDANLNGRTIFVGPRLPNSARDIVMRTLRVNQVPVSSAVNFLVGLGAETAVSRERLVTSVTAVPITTDEGLVVEDAEQRETQTTTEERVEIQRVDYQDSTPILRGLAVIGDERTNSVTLVGPARLVEMATSQMVTLDIRRRQVAINVRVIDVNLLGLNRASSSFSFGLGDFDFVQDNGLGVINFGNNEPFGVNITETGIGNTATQDLGLPFGFDFTRDFLAQLQFAVTSGNAKVLTDPTLVVQEGQVAQVQLTQDVVTNFQIETTGTGEDRTQTIEVERTPAGLVLDVQVDRVDDNGFISLSVAPAISAPTATQDIEVEGAELSITLLAIRRLSSGQIRVRDGQTLVLSGIIQDQDRATVTKIPILGDIPILGALFRRTERRNERQEVIVLLTPQILNDSDTSTFGYRYSPSPAAQELIRQGRQ